MRGRFSKPVNAMMTLPPSVRTHMEEISARLLGYPKLQSLYRACYPDALTRAAERLPDGTTFLYTGDIPAMWLRDSAAQITPYLPLAKGDADLRALVKGLIRRQISDILTDPYANSFQATPVGHHYKNDIPQAHPRVWERKYEIDSLCYPIRLLYLYYKMTEDASVLDASLLEMTKTVLSLWKREQDHTALSSYRFMRPGARQSDTLPNGGRGYPVNITGMTWSGFRPSDDACTFGYPVASNMFAAVSLRQLEELLNAYHPEKAEQAEIGSLQKAAGCMREEITYGISVYGVVHHPKYGPIYAYETDGFGNHLLMDDANVPSLLSAPYLGFCSSEDPLYQNTRRFILSEDNPYYFRGSAAAGIGSPHTPRGYIWPIALSMQGLTARDDEEIRGLLRTLCLTDGDTGLMHESFDANDPVTFTRPWFSWANALFAEFTEYALSRNLLP